MDKKLIMSNDFSSPFAYTVYSGYSGHVYSGLSDIVATLPGTKYINSIILGRI